MKKGIVVGKEERSYEKNGEKKMARTLHVLWDEAKVPQEGESGCKVEAVFVRSFPIDNIPVGAYCGFEYDIMPGKNGAMAILSEIKVLGTAKIHIELPKI